MRAALVIVVLLLAAIACTPRNLSPECKDQIDHCLKECPPSDDHMGIGGSGLIGIGDSRTACQRGCHHVCDTPEDKARPVPPDEGIPTL